MNYLGHAYLSYNNADTLCGNMIGDFVKGAEAVKKYPEEIQKGLMLHRHIDSFTDQHPSITAAKQFFRPVYGLYSGAVVDTLMDHFIANDASLFSDVASLEMFASNVYHQLQTKEAYFPERFHPYFESMKLHNWLINYRSEAGLKQSLNGLKRRAKHIEEMETAFALFVEHKSALQVHYNTFIQDVILFVKFELGID